MNDDLPRLTRAGFETLIALLPGGYPGRVAINPYNPLLYTVYGDHISRPLIDRLVADGYLQPSPPPPNKAMYYDVSEQAKKLKCPDCRGDGREWLEDSAGGDAIPCRRCSGRRLIAPGTDSTPVYTIPPKRPKKPRESPVFAPHDPSPTEPGYYWLALDDGESFLEGAVFLVQVVDRLYRYGLDGEHEGRSVRVKFWGERYYDIEAEDFAGIRERAIHRMGEASSIGGLVACSADVGEHRLNWLGRAYPPRLPKEIAPC